MSVTEAISVLLQRWQELRQLGKSPSVESLCADRPDLADELSRRIAAFQSMESMLGMGLDSKTSTHSGSEEESVPFTPSVQGSQLPNYELLEVIAQGGMGVVYKARQRSLQRVVAVKMIAGYRADPKQVARFQVEAEAVAHLQHPNIIQIYEVGEVQGKWFFSMEYVEGGSLAEQLGGEALAPHAAAQLLETLARAIHFAHARGIIHRDLKPANILLQTHPPRPVDLSNPKITDFGLAKRLDADTDHTRTGEIIGTPNYMSPEQAEGKTTEIGPLSDVYALGAILYEALTGKRPFQSKTVMDTLRRIVAEDPISPRKFQPKVPRDLEAICLKCLEKSPNHRYVTAEAMADDLNRFLHGRVVAARPLSLGGRAWKWAKRHPTKASLFVTVLLLLAGGAGKKVSDHRQQQLRAVQVAPQVREILHRHCFECHGDDPQLAERKFQVLDRSALLDEKRKIIVPGSPSDSRLIHRIEDGSMPPEEEEERLPRVSYMELAVLQDWVIGGAPPFPESGPIESPVVPHAELAGEVKAIFLKHCYECHRFTVAKGGIKILNYDLLVVKRRVVVPGDPQQSEIYQLLLLPPEHEHAMPPAPRKRLSPDEIEKVRLWIELGATPFPKTE